MIFEEERLATWIAHEEREELKLTSLLARVHFDLTRAQHDRAMAEARVAEDALAKALARAETARQALDRSSNRLLEAAEAVDATRYLWRQ